MTPIAITMGEPAGIGGELTIKAWKEREKLGFLPFFTIDNIVRLKALFADLPIQEISEPNEAINVFETALPVINIDLNEEPVLGELNPNNSKAVIESIERAVDFCLKGEASAIVTNPIHKAALYEAGFQHPGHTEFIGDLCEKYSGNKVTPVMMLAAKDLRVVPLTVHIPLKDVPSAINAELLAEKSQIIHEDLQKYFKIASPRIAVAGLNPHAGEDGTIGLEDRDILEPAIQAIKDQGLNLSGPYPADTLFHEEARANYDIAIGMYHDQALIPLKTLDFHGGVNATLGLPIIRTSPDHGTALNIAGKNLARPDSFMNAIKMAEEMAKNNS